MDPAALTVSYPTGTWVKTTDGPVRLGQGDALPENVHPDEVARLANAGVLAGLDAEPTLMDPALELPDGTVEELKVRIGDDPDLAAAYLEQEQGRDKPRATFVTHLEQVLADADEDRG